MSLGLLVGRFAAFLNEQPATFFDSTPSEAAFPRDLERLREQFGHHIVLLTLLSRSDGEAVMLEREVILHHCLEQAHTAGEPATASEAAELGDTAAIALFFALSVLSIAAGSYSPFLYFRF